MKKTAKKIGQKSLALRLKDTVDAVAEQLEGVFAISPKDIVAAVKEDHRALRNYLGTLKDTEQDMTDRRRAYAGFSALLKSHTVAEEKAVYAPTTKLAGREMHIKVAEGFVEHKLAEDIMKRLERATDPLAWSAHANVLAEIVEHHLKEEEKSLLPLIRKAATATENAAMLDKFMALRAASQKRVTAKNAGVLKTKA